MNWSVKQNSDSVLISEWYILSPSITIVYVYYGSAVFVIGCTINPKTLHVFEIGNEWIYF